MANYKELIDSTTGEVILAPSNYSPETHSIVSNRQTEYQKAWRENGSNQFTFAMQEKIAELLKTEKLNLTDLGAVTVLLPYLDDDGYLKKRTTKDKPFLGRDEIQEILKLSDRTFARVIKELKDCGILSVEGNRKNQIFKINPEYHLRGRLPAGIDKVVRIQNRGIKSAYEEGNSDVKLDQIGFLYLLIPHLSYSNCRLVKEINGEDDIDNALSVEELAERIGLSVKTAIKYLKFKIVYKFKEGTYSIPLAISFCAYGEKHKKSTIINPIFYRRNMEVTGEIKFSDLDVYFRNASKKC